MADFGLDAPAFCITRVGEKGDRGDRTGRIGQRAAIVDLCDQIVEHGVVA